MGGKSARRTGGVTMEGGNFTKGLGDMEVGGNANSLIPFSLYGIAVCARGAVWWEVTTVRERVKQETAVVPEPHAF